MQEQMQKLMDEFGNAIQELADNVKRCGDIYLQAIEMDASARKLFPEKFSYLPRDMWHCLEKVGRNLLAPQCLFYSPSIFNVMQYLALDEQLKVLDVGIDYLASSGNVLRVKLENMGLDMLREVFAHDHIRTPGEQRLYRERMANRRKIKRPMESFEVKEGCLIVYQECRFTIEDIRRLLP